MGLYTGGLIIGRIFVSEIWGLIFGRTYFWGGLISEFYGIYILKVPTEDKSVLASRKTTQIG